MSKTISSKAGVQLAVEQTEILEKAFGQCMAKVSGELTNLLRRPVVISTPQVSMDTTGQVLDQYQIPFVIVEFSYQCQANSRAYLLVKEPDALLMAGILSGAKQVPEELTREHMTVMSEVANVIVGASALTLGEHLGQTVNYTDPVANLIDVDKRTEEIMDARESVAMLNCILEIEGGAKSSLILLLPSDSAAEFADLLLEADAPPAPKPKRAGRKKSVKADPETVAAIQEQPYPTAAQPQGRTIPASPGMVNVSPVQYPPFEQQQYVPADGDRGMNLVYDIPLAVTVELGRTRKNISDILELGIGSIFTLDKMAGEPVEIMANGKMIARGDVVVIDESYGVRITDIVND